MPKYRLEFTGRAKKEFVALPSQVRKRVARWLELLREDPHRAGTKQLEGHAGIRRVHAGKDYVVVYAIQREEVMVLVIRVAHRREAYRGL